MSSSKISSSKKSSKRLVNEDESDGDIIKHRSSSSRDKESDKLESNGRSKSSSSTKEKSERASKKTSSKEKGESSSRSSSKDSDKGKTKSGSKEKDTDKEDENEENHLERSKRNKSHKSSSSSSKKRKEKGEACMLYALVARGKYILAECSTRSGDYAEIAMEEMAAAPTEKSSFTIPHGDYTLNFVVENGITYMVMSDSHLLRETSQGFLERVKEDFPKRYTRKLLTAKPGSLSLEYGPKILQHMEYVLAHPEEMSKTSKIKAQVAEVKGVMQQNIQKALQRGEKLEVLQEKSDLLESQANLFKKQGGELQTKFWLNNLKMKLMVLGGLFLLATFFLIPLLGIPHVPTYSQIGRGMDQYEYSGNVNPNVPTTTVRGGEPKITPAEIPP